MLGICLSSVHPNTLEILKEIRIIGLLPDVTEICYQVNVIYQISLIQTDFYTTNLQSCETPLWRICAQEKNYQNECEGCTLSLKSAYRTYNVLCISDVLKKTTI